MIQVDPQIQTNLSGTHISTDGSGIAPGAPDPVQPYGVSPGITSFTARRFAVNGPAYAVFEAYATRPAPPARSTNGILQLDIITDSNAPAHSQIIELDTIICLGGFKYNGSQQLNNHLGGQAQIVNAAGQWVSVPGGLFRPLPPNLMQRYELFYSFDTVKRTFSFEEIRVAGAVCTVPASMQNIPATPTTWPDQALFQVQLGLNAEPGAFAVEVDNAQYVWAS